MPSLHNLRCGIAGLLILSGAAAAAEDPLPAFALKLRTAYQAAAPKDQLARRMLGFGLEAGIQKGAHRFALELGWSYKPGDQYREDLSGMVVAPGRGLTLAKSVDSRRNELKGLAARASWMRLFGPLSVQAGLQVGGTQWRQEYIADLQGTALATPSTMAFRDTYNGVVERGGTTVSPFVGCTLPLEGGTALEINILALRYRSAQYVHQAGFVDGLNGNVSQDSRLATNRTATHLEIAYVVRF